MKSKQILLVVVVFAVLAGLYFLQQSNQPEVLLDLGYEKLGAPAADIAGIACYLAGKEDPAVALVLREGRWLVESKLNAPASETKVQELLEKVEELEGDLRSSSADVLKDYGIADDQALRLDLSGKDGQPIQRLLLGNQGPGYNEMFVRQPGSDSVYLARQNLRSLFGLYGSGGGQVPEGKAWLDTTVLSIPKEEIARIETTSPYRDLLLEYQATLPPVVGDATDVPPPEPVYIPVLVEPQVSGATKSYGIDRLAGAFASVTVSDVVDRGGLEKYGLEPPQARVTVTTRAGEARRLEFGNAIPGESAWYMKRDDSDLVYKMDRWKVESLFLKLSDLVDLKAPSIVSDEVTGVSLMRNGRTYSFERKDGAWRFAGPGMAERFRVDEIDSMLSALTQLKPQDEATRGGVDVTGLNRPEAVIELVLKEGPTRTIYFGKEASLTDGARFVRFDEGPQVYTVTRSSYEQCNPEAGDLFDLALADWDVAEAVALRVKDASGDLALAKAVPQEATAPSAEFWTVQGGERESLSAGRVMALLAKMASLSARDIVLQPKAGGLEQPSWSVEVTFQDGEDYRLDLSELPDSSGYGLRLKGEEAVFLLDAESGNRLMALSRGLRAPQGE